ncbi:hypothetical protein T492DRAFT_1148487 [Pavlovales sp. CCMP2436]|nr:hypothetical protein T492DRAFT_1148487 [Pavlovales sp. CCMP2436]
MVGHFWTYRVPDWLHEVWQGRLMAWGIARGVVEVPLEAWPIRTSYRPAAARHVKCGSERKKTKTGPIVGQPTPTRIGRPGGPQSGPAASGGGGHSPPSPPRRGPRLAGLLPLRDEVADKVGVARQVDLRLPREVDRIRPPIPLDLKLDELGSHARVEEGASPAAPYSTAPSRRRGRGCRKNCFFDDLRGKAVSREISSSCNGTGIGVSACSQGTLGSISELSGRSRSCAIVIHVEITAEISDSSQRAARSLG